MGVSTNRGDDTGSDLSVARLYAEWLDMSQTTSVCIRHHVSFAFALGEGAARLHWLRSRSRMEQGRYSPSWSTTLQPNALMIISLSQHVESGCGAGSGGSSWPLPFSSTSHSVVGHTFRDPSNASPFALL